MRSSEPGHRVQVAGRGCGWAGSLSLGVRLLHTPMTSQGPKRKWIWGALLCAVAVLCGYVSSVGPAYSLVMRNQIPCESVLSFYQPVPGRVQRHVLELWMHIDPKVALAFNGERDW